MKNYGGSVLVCEITTKKKKYSSPNYYHNQQHSSKPENLREDC